VCLRGHEAAAAHDSFKTPTAVELEESRAVVVKNRDLGDSKRTAERHREGSRQHRAGQGPSRSISKQFDSRAHRHSGTRSCHEATSKDLLHVEMEDVIADGDDDPLSGRPYCRPPTMTLSPMVRVADIIA
jgi:hypothetical protein